MSLKLLYVSMGWAGLLPPTSLYSVHPSPASQPSRRTALHLWPIQR